MAAHIDAHLHLSCDGEAGLQLLVDLDLKLLNISVPTPERERWRDHRLARSIPESTRRPAALDRPL